MQRKLWRFRTVGLLVVLCLLLVTAVTGCGSSTKPEDNSQSQPQQSQSTQGTQESKGTVNIGYVNWAEDVAVSNLWKEILESQGYTVKLQSLDVAPLFVGLNKGDLDVFMDSWLPVTHQSYWDKYKDSLDDYGVWYLADAKIGLVVPKYVTIDSIDQMKAEKAKFNGQIIGIDPGAGIMKAADKANKDYGLGFQVVQGSEAAMMAALGKAVQDNKWVAITGWSPHWMFAKYELKYLNDPKKDFGAAEALHTLASKSFAQKTPAVAEMLKKFKMTDQQIGGLEDLINQGMAPQDAAKKWIQENQSVVDGWIK
ncbi:MAG: glycine betaine ABC transporter substrate-binding protein [Eubacteriales bacterium]